LSKPGNDTAAETIPAPRPLRDDPEYRRVEDKLNQFKLELAEVDRHDGEIRREIFHSRKAGSIYGDEGEALWKTGAAPVAAPKSPTGGRPEPADLADLRDRRKLLEGAIRHGEQELARNRNRLLSAFVAQTRAWRCALARRVVASLVEAVRLAGIDERFIDGVRDAFDGMTGDTPPVRLTVLGTGGDPNGHVGLHAAWLISAGLIEPSDAVLEGTGVGAKDRREAEQREAARAGAEAVARARALAAEKEARAAKAKHRAGARPA
jgi:hypothetical protein